MGLPPEDYPALGAAHLAGARLFASRHDMIAAMKFLTGGIIGEIGVRAGDFSEFLLNELKPARLVAFDAFTMDQYPFASSRPTERVFRGETQLDFYHRRFAERGEQVVIERGWSRDGLARQAPRSFDLIYVDGGRDYDVVKCDAELAAEKIKENGILIFAGYQMFDHVTDEAYGVIPAVNELVVGEGWRVFGLALERAMSCAIAVQP